MERLLLSAFLLLVINASAQNVGINSTGATPNASAGLDVDFTNKGFLIPRVALTQTNSNAPIGATIVTSLLVYNTATINDVTPGFYYWNGTTWIRFQSNLDIDHDWYEVGTTTAPNNINDNKYTYGNIGIGNNTPGCPLVVFTNSVQKAVLITSQDTSVNPKTGIELFMNDAGSGSTTGISVSTVASTSTGQKIAYAASHTNTGSPSNMFGYTLNTNGTGNSGEFAISYTTVSSGNGSKFGLSNTFSVNSRGSSYGMSNGFSSSGTDIAIGVQNNYQSRSATKYGVYNDYQSADSGTFRGLFNNITNTGDGQKYGVYNNYTGAGDANFYGAYTVVPNTGNGRHYGTFNHLSGTGIGAKYALYDTIPLTASGKNFGVFSSALDTASDYAGFFRGKLSVGMDYTNNYVFPTTRGNNNDVMITDAVGNVSWQSISSLTNNYWTRVNDSLYPTITTNNIGIGTPSANSPLTISTGTADTNAIQIVQNYNGASASNGMKNYFPSSATGDVGAMNNIFSANGTGNKWGIQNTFSSRVRGQQTGYNNFFQSSATNTNIGVLNEFFGRASNKYGFYNSYVGTDTSLFYGVYNLVTNSGINNKYGVYTDISNAKLGALYGAYNRINGGDSTVQNGVYNELIIPATADYGAGRNGTYNRITNNSTSVNVGAKGTVNQFLGTGIGNLEGMLNTFNNTGSANITGVRNNIIGQNFNNMTHIGINNFLFDAYNGRFNLMTGTQNYVTGNSNGRYVGTLDSVFSYGSGPIYGNMMEIHRTNSVVGSNYGNYILMRSAGTGTSYGNSVDFGSGSSGSVVGNGIHYGYYISDTTSGTGIHYGNYAYLAGFGTGTQFGSRTDIVNTGNGTHYGSFVNITGGTGANYGYSSTITAPGVLNVGLYASASGATTNYAGIFNGDVIPNFTSTSAATGYQLGTTTYRWRDVWCWRGLFNGSDIRLKTNIKPIPYGLKEVLTLNPITYTWKADSLENEKKYELGLSSQQVKQLIPEVIETGTDSMQTLMMNYSALIPVLVKAIQEQQKIIDEQTASIEKLKTDNQNIEELKQTIADKEKQYNDLKEQVAKINLLLGIDLEVKKE